MSSDSSSTSPALDTEIGPEVFAAFRAFAASQRAHVDKPRAIQTRQLPEVNIEDLKTFSQTFKLRPLANTTTIEQELARISQPEAGPVLDIPSTANLEMTVTEENDVSKQELYFENPSVPKEMEWVMESKEKILAIHSSDEYTRDIFGL
jgi:hypothetical protein